MAAPLNLKNWFNRARYERFADQLAALVPRFDRRRFLGLTCDDLDSRELLARLRCTTEAIHATVPGNYAQQLDILRQLAPQIGHSFVAIIPSDFVGCYGRTPEHFNLSMNALAEFTPHGSAEFAIREFLRIDLSRTLAVMREWSRSPDEHIRRLSSEGCRPRLPWSFRLEALIADPSPVLPILENLRADPSLYVRKSVANHLNDISKDHPAWMLERISSWDFTHPHTTWIAKRAARTLIKKGDRTALALFGFGQAPKIQLTAFRLPSRIHIGDTLAWSCTLTSVAQRPQTLAVDYVVHYRKPSGKNSPKVFKWTELTLPSGESVVLKKKHRFCNFSTRTHVKGAHQLDVQINGRLLASKKFMLRS